MEFESSLMTSNGSPLMSTNSSPLEVLSNAAALIEKSKTYDELQIKFSNTIKELPTKENKLKRNKDRRELAHSSSFKMKARSSSPPNDEPMLCDRSEHSLSPNFSPTVFTRNTDLYETNANNPPINAPPSYSTYINLSQRAAADRNGLLSSYRGSPYQQIDGTKPSTLMRRNSDPNSQQSTQSSCDSLEEEDKPLDMSNKKYRNQEWSESQSSPPPPELRSDLSLSRSPMNSPSNIFGQQMMRPSVITCAPSLKSQPNESPLQSLSPTFNCQNCCTNGDQLGDSVGDHNACKRHRNRQLYVTEEVSDPVIEEHFRRSLGKDYSQIFSNSTNNNSITYSVDDHFAKALGDTWIRLQKTSTRLEESSKPNNAQSIAS